MKSAVKLTVSGVEIVQFILDSKLLQIIEENTVLVLKRPSQLWRFIFPFIEFYKKTFGDISGAALLPSNT